MGKRMFADHDSGVALDAERAGEADKDERPIPPADERARVERGDRTAHLADVERGLALLADAMDAADAGQHRTQLGAAGRRVVSVVAVDGGDGRGATGDGG